MRAKLVSYPQTRRHAKAHRVESAVFRALMFVFVAVTAYGVSSIAGQVAVEKSRREEIGAKVRAKSLALMETSLHNAITELTRPDKIDDWARANQFEYSGPSLHVGQPKPQVLEPSDSDLDVSSGRSLVALRE